MGGNRSKERDRKSELDLRSTNQIFELDRNHSDRNFYNVVSMFTYPQCPECRSEAKRSDVPYGHASILLLGEESEATEPYNKYNKIRPNKFNYVNDFPNSCKIIFPFLFADDANCVYARPKNETSTLQDGVEHIPGWMAMNKLSQNIPKTELVHFLNCKDESIVMKNTEITCTEYVKYLGISLIVVINLLNRRDADY